MTKENKKEIWKIPKVTFNSDYFKCSNPTCSNEKYMKCKYDKIVCDVCGRFMYRV